KQLLELAGHEVYEANDGPSGVERARAVSPSAVLVDIGLPGLDGYDVARRIRAARRDVILVALTGYGQAEDRLRSSDAGVDAHFTKPVDPAALIEFLAGAPRARGARQSD